MVFFWEYLKGGGEGHLFLNKIVDFGGPKLAKIMSADVWMNPNLKIET